MSGWACVSRQSIVNHYIFRSPENFVVRRALKNYIFDFSSESPIQILMKLGHNDLLVVGIWIYT